MTEKKIRHVVPIRINRIRKGTRQVVVTCPYCGKNHCHGWPYEDADIGYRSSDCLKGGSYYIDMPDKHTIIK